MRDKAILTVMEEIEKFKIKKCSIGYRKSIGIFT